MGSRPWEATRMQRREGGEGPVQESSQALLRGQCGLLRERLPTGQLLPRSELHILLQPQGSGASQGHPSRPRPAAACVVASLPTVKTIQADSGQTLVRMQFLSGDCLLLSAALFQPGPSGCPQANPPRSLTSLPHCPDLPHMPTQTNIHSATCFFPSGAELSPLLHPDFPI